MVLLDVGVAGMIPFVLWGWDFCLHGVGNGGEVF